jgi:hypothetical protein
VSPSRFQERLRLPTNNLPSGISACGDKRFPERLIDHLDKLGIKYALIRGYQPEPVNARRGRNSPVSGVSQGSEQGNIQGYFIRQWKNAKNRVGIQVPEEFIQGNFQSRFFSTCQYGDFQWADCADSHRLAPPDCRLERPQLCPGELSGFE